MTDDAGLVPGSEQWLAYWIERADKILQGDDEVSGCRIPLEVMDAILETADSVRRMPSDNVDYRATIHRLHQGSGLSP